MWKRNAFSLRSCPSAFASNGWGWRASEAPRRVRHISGSSYGLLPRSTHEQDGSEEADVAIGDDEFLDALHKVLPLEKLQPPSQNVGIAVSGGVDSMALATLYANCERSKLPSLHGIIIDHKARPGSTTEAHWVAGQLSNLGLESTIITLTWPEDPALKHSSRFEAEARRLRYQALGKACSDKDIKSLLVAHHADDQAETIMMRLMKWRLRSGLQGMRPIEWIPECYGIHGVHHSGTPVSQGDPFSSLVEGGGIQILRPLLGFEKSRLIATCKKHNTSWAEDKTNQDKTLTARNALRYVIRNHQLPKALSKDSMLVLAQASRSRMEKYQAAAETLFNSCSLKLDIQIGTLKVRLPPVEALFPTRTSNPSSSDKIHARNTAHSLLQRVVGLVSPNESVAQESLANAVLNVYPALAPERRRTDLANFTSNHCSWSKIDNSSAFDCSTKDTPDREHNDWLLLRQPPPREQIKAFDLTFLPRQTSDWHFFDGRFWVRLRNLTDRPIIMRMITDLQIEKLLQTNPNDKPEEKRPHLDAFSHGLSKHLRYILTTIKPHVVRRHLPALFLESADAEQEPTLLAFPTLQTSLRKAQNPLYCTWEVRYKKIDPGARSLSEIITRPREYRSNHNPRRGEREETRPQLDSILGVHGTA